MATTALLGTGLLGSGFALKMLERGEDLVVWNRTPDKTAPLVQAGARAAATPADAVADADRVHLVLAEDSAVDAVLSQALPALPQGAWVIDHSTNAPALVAERTARLRAEGVRYVHAPVFMSPRDARNATGLMLLSASDEDAAVLTPILEQMTGRLWHVGERADLAAVHKISGNGMLIALAGTMGDLFAIAQARGLPPDAVIALFDVFRAGGAIPFIGKRVVAAPDMDTSFALTMARKDVRLMIDAAGGPDDLVVLPGLAAAMDKAIEAGLGDKDFAVFAWPGREQ
ncbi:MAG: NAD(P)-dependent oxidoreductase [Deltaproteobacteria bacterium]|nr:MAG: NAD(P)-dependent oxidoreductase [Deltaproteobacteria bacterium]